MVRTKTTKKKIAPTNSRPNLINAVTDAIRGTKDAKLGLSLSMIRRLTFSTKSKIPATKGVRLM